MKLTVVAPFRSELPRAPAGARAFVLGNVAAGGSPPALPGEGGLVITGSCGALGPGVPLGSLVMPAEIVDADGTIRRPDDRWTAAFRVAVDGAGLSCREERLIEVGEVTDEPAARARLAAATAASFVDLESATLAAAAAAVDRPWLVLRFVSDSPERPLSWLPALFGGWPESEPGPGTVLAALARRPWLFPRLLALGMVVRRGRLSVEEILRKL